MSFKNSVEIGKKIIFEKELPYGKFMTFLEGPDFPYLHVRQVHGPDIVEVGNGTGSSPMEIGKIEADGLLYCGEILPNQGMALAISTADCLPIVILGEKGFAHLHAGWRGLQNGLLMSQSLSKIRPFYSFIGPSIRKCCFEVGEDFYQYFPHSTAFERRNGRHYFDLQKEAIQILMTQFPSIKVEDAFQCTFCSGSYHSYRKNKTSLRNKNLYWYDI